MRANASRKSHAELDEAEELDEGDPAELADQYRTLRALLPAATVIGGCCGTDHRHVAARGGRLARSGVGPISHAGGHGVSLDDGSRQ